MGKSSSTASTTNNTDARIANDSGVAVSGSGNSINVETVDAQIVGQALDTVQISDALTADQFNKLLDVAGGLFAGGERLIGQTQSAVADAYSQAQTDAKSTIDNRTIVVLGVAAAGAVAAFALRKK